MGWVCIKSSIRANASHHSDDLPIGPQRLQSIARNTSLQLLNWESLTLNQAVVDLLYLKSGQVEELNSDLREFVRSLQSEEVAHAYVLKKADGNEEIVVASFDRSKQIENLRNKIALKLGNEIADFIGKQTAYDAKLAVNNSEMRLYIEHDDDGTDYVVVRQEALRRDALDSKIPIQQGNLQMAPTYDMSIKVPLSNGINSRYSHLFSASDRMPRRK